MAYTDANTVSNPTTGQPILAAWGDQIRTNQEFFIDPPACSVYASSAQSVSNVTDTQLTANSENYDNDSMHSTVSNTSRITCQTAGRFLAGATVNFGNNATGYRVVRLRVNGTTTYSGMNISAAAGGSNTIITVSRTLVLAASDYVEVQVVQSSGGALNVTLDEFFCLFQTR